MHLPSTLTLSAVHAIAQSGEKVELSDVNIATIDKGRNYLESLLLNKTRLTYGVNTGFGYLQNVAISDDKLIELQVNLLKSHACGTGATIPKEIVKLMLLLKAYSLSKGHSGIQTSTVQRLLDFYNLDLIPVVYEQGSLGASGDLAPLSHLCLPLLGLGEMWENNKIVPAANLLSKHNLAPISIGAKEGLALINGTQFMGSIGVHILNETKAWVEKIHLISALSTDVFHCRMDPFLPFIHNVRPHWGQKQAASRMLEYLEKSPLQKLPRPDVQDAYSFRCIPQVHGASLDVLQTVSKVFEIEINSVTDNPLIFPDEDIVISGGNFHGQTLAIHLDLLAIALAELANISERRIYKLIGGERGLPLFLTPKPGLNSGLMIAQYTAASIVSQNKQLCTPASIDSIVSSNGQEDHVSMGANAATKCLKVLENLKTVIAIEWLCASQALSLREDQHTFPEARLMYDEFRREVPEMESDREIHQDIKKSLAFLQEQI